MSFLKPDPPTINIPQPIQPEAPPPVLSPQGSKPAPKKSTQTFLGTSAVPPPSQSGGQTGKTLLGQ